MSEDSKVIFVDRSTERPITAMFREWLSVQVDGDEHKITADSLDRDDEAGELLYQGMVKIAESMGVPLESLRMWPSDLYMAKSDGMGPSGAIQLTCTFNYEKWDGKEERQDGVV